VCVWCGSNLSLKRKTFASCHGQTQAEKVTVSVLY
jgi:hypothetical protein